MRLANALANTLARLGSIACETGEAARASELYRESLEPVRRFVFRYEAVACLEGLARVEAVLGRPERAARLLGAAAAMREDVGSRLTRITRSDHDHSRVKCQWPELPLQARLRGSNFTVEQSSPGHLIR